VCEVWLAVGEWGVIGGWWWGLGVGGGGGFPLKECPHFKKKAGSVHLNMMTWGTNKGGLGERGSEGLPIFHEKI